EDRRDVFIRQIREAIAEEKRKDIIERLWKGRQERGRQGKTPGGTPPYGFRRIHKKGFVIESHEASIVRAIFELFDSGASRETVARTLNARGFTRRNGKPWTRFQVAAIISRRGLYEEGAMRYGEVAGSNSALALVKRRGAA